MMHKYFIKMVLVFLTTGFVGLNGFALDLESSAFKNGGYIPDRYSCDAQDFSPALSFSGSPAGAKSLVLICEDPDAPFKIWVHWVLFNIPANITGLKENISAQELSALGIIQGINDFGSLGYRGPCPPQGKPHRYVFNLYALDIALSLAEGVNKSQVVTAMQGHIIAEGKITASYQRK